MIRAMMAAALCALLLAFDAAGAERASPSAPAGPSALPSPPPSASAPAPAPGAVPAAAATPPTESRARAAKEWNRLRTPAPGPPRSIGGFSAGCLQGAATLSPSGPGYEVARIGRNRRYGHPELVAFVQRLGAGARRAKLGPLVVGDLAQPRGGPTPTGHHSHQTGLDADLGYAPPTGLRAGHLTAKQRETLAPVIVVDLKTRTPTAAWGTKVLELIALAASDPAVDRIFVHPTVKRLLCEAPRSAKMTWQPRIRPWWGHHDHFHVRLRCPTDSPLCVSQDPVPDDGCGASLRWWFTADAEAALVKKKEAEAAAAAAAAAAGEEKVQLPAACTPVRTAPDAEARQAALPG
jgi:penicillin-insensitive murein endopeptidase